MTEKKLCVVAFGAHPDDCEIKTGGTAVRFARAGHRFVFVSLTNGDTGHHEIGGLELARRRKKEAEAAAAVAGVESRVLDIHCGELLPDLYTRRRVIELLREFKPDLVMSHRPNDYHPDHRSAAQLVQDAVYLATVPNNVALTEALLEMPVVVYFSDSFRKPYPFTPDVAIDIDDVVETKLDMLHCHESQMYEWLPFNRGVAADVPDGDAARREWLRQDRMVWLEEPANQAREILRKQYGEEKGARIKCAEAFEACEYGKALTSENIKVLFPFQ